MRTTITIDGQILEQLRERVAPPGGSARREDPPVA